MSKLNAKSVYCIQFMTVVLFFMAGCGPTRPASTQDTQKQEKQDRRQQVLFEAKVTDWFDWNTYQAVPKSHRSQLAEAQAEWLDELNDEVKNQQKAARAENALARKDMYTENHDNQIKRFKEFKSQLGEHGLDNWLFYITEKGLVTGQMPVYQRKVARSYFNRFEYDEDVILGWLLTLDVDVRTLSDEARTVIRSAKKGDVVFVSLPPGSFYFEVPLHGPSGTIIADYSKGNEHPRLAAVPQRLIVEHTDKLRIGTRRDPETFKQTFVEKQAEDIAAEKAIANERQHQLNARNAKIERLKENLIQHIIRQNTNSSALHSWIRKPGEYFTDTLESEPPSLQELKSMGYATDDLRKDTRIRFFSTLNYYTASRGSYGGARMYVKKMNRLVDHDVILKEYFEGHYGRRNRAESVARQLEDLIRFDVHSQKYLVRAAKIADARANALENSMEGRFWKNRLAQVATLVENSEVILFSDVNTPVKLGNGGLEEGLKMKQPSSVPSLMQKQSRRESEREREVERQRQLKLRGVNR